jgi:hypothetical protein
MCGAPHAHAVGLSLGPPAGALETGGDDGLPHMQATAQATPNTACLYTVVKSIAFPSALLTALICLQHVSCIW